MCRVIDGVTVGLTAGGGRDRDRSLSRVVLRTGLYLRVDHGDLPRDGYVLALKDSYNMMDLGLELYTKKARCGNDAIFGLRNSGIALKRISGINNTYGVILVLIDRMIGRACGLRTYSFNRKIDIRITRGLDRLDRA